MRKRTTVAVLGGVAAAGAIVGFSLSGVGAAGHRSFDASLVAATPSPGAASRPFHPNEDPNHEKNESASREAAENSGKFFGGPFHSNESATHEKSESAAREAQENAGKAPTTP